jgi:hypothetical protein
MCAGFIVVAGNLCGSAEWGNCIPAGLGFMLTAVVVSVYAIARSSQDISSDHVAQGISRRLWLILAAAILLHGVVAVVLCKTVPAKTIDCFTFQRDASSDLAHGINPYSTTQLNIYGPEETAKYYGPGMVVNGMVQTGFTYPPLTIYWTLPGYFLGDVRYSYILAMILAALFSFAMVPSRRGLGFTLFLLLNPLSFYVENRCWTEPLVLMALCATMYAAVKKRWWLPVALGLFLATKQYNFLALPFIGFLVLPFRWKSYLRLIGSSLAVAAATVLPFVFWDLRAIWHDLVLFHLAQPYRTDSLSFAVAFPWMMKIGPMLLLVFVAWSAAVGVRNRAMFAVGYGVSILVFFLTSKQAFCNYYFLIGQTLLLAAAALPGILPRSRMLADAE